MYGGTKEEMQRLLGDAEKLSGKEYDISNLSDVYEAIHLIQTELGITGTTALEAEETISGSFNAMKGAFDNFLVALASGSDEDIKEAMENLIETTTIFAENIGPVIAVALESIGNVIVEYAPKLAEKIPELFQVLIEKIIEYAPKMAEGAVMLVTSMAEGLANNADKIAEEGVKLAITLAKAIIKSAPKIVVAAAKLVLAFVTALLKGGGKIISAGGKFVNSIINGINKKMYLMVDGAVKVVSKFATGIKGKISDIISAGGDLVRGLWEGIKAKLEWIREKISGFGGGVIKAVKKIFGISSPAKKMIPLGEFIVDGLGVGIKNKSPELINIIKKVGEKAIVATQKAIEKRKDKYKTSIQGIVDTFKAGIEEVEKNIETLASQTHEAYGFFDIPKPLNPDDVIPKDFLISNLEKAKERTEQFVSLIISMKDKLPRDMLDELAEGGVKNLEQLQEFAKFTDEELTDYVEMYKEKAKISNEFAKDYFQGDREKVYSDREKALKKANKSLLDSVTKDVKAGMELKGDELVRVAQKTTRRILDEIAKLKEAESVKSQMIQAGKDMISGDKTKPKKSTSTSKNQGRNASYSYQVNINQPVQSPIETARAVTNNLRYGVL